jgi:spermidine synthase
MKPQVTIDRTTTPDGKELVLYERDGVYTIRVDGLELMSSRTHGSEEEMAELVMAEIGAAKARILVGGLGMGYTLRAVLDHASAKAEVVVAELLPEVIRWNREHIGELARSPIDDPRVVVEERDVAAVLEESPNGFDAILLDVDNGPAALTDRRNARLYQPPGLAAIRRCLRRNGVLAVWSAAPDRRFERSLNRTGFQARTVTVSARRGAKGPKHTIFIAR